MLSVIIQSVIMLLFGVVKLSVIMLSVIVLSVMARGIQKNILFDRT